MCFLISQIKYSIWYALHIGRKPDVIRVFDLYDISQFYSFRDDILFYYFRFLVHFYNAGRSMSRDHLKEQLVFGDSLDRFKEVGVQTKFMFQFLLAFLKQQQR